MCWNKSISFRLISQAQILSYYLHIVRESIIKNTEKSCTYIHKELLRTTGKPNKRDPCACGEGRVYIGLIWCYKWSDIIYLGYLYSTCRHNTRRRHCKNNDIATTTTGGLHMVLLFCYFYQSIYYAVESGLHQKWIDTMRISTIVFYQSYIMTPWHGHNLCRFRSLRARSGVYSHSLSGISCLTTNWVASDLRRCGAHSTSL